MIASEALKAHRETLRAKGICTACHKRKTDGGATCDRCRARARKYKATIDFSVICKWCGGPLDREGVHCTACLPKAAASVRKCHDNHVAAGLCVSCGRTNDGTTDRCVNCQMKDTRAVAMRNCRVR
jgi:predicted amidophosphoribosyltransferase